MANKRQIKHGIEWLQTVKTWQLILVLIVMLFLTATLLRLNNVGMVQRRNAVMAADKHGEINDIHARIYDLQRYAAAHMNADTNTFYLQGQYDRDSEKALKDAQAANPGSNANAEAEAVCKPQFSGYSSAYLQCFLRELEKRPTTEKLPEIKTPSPALYQYNFVSPLWSPDFAGFSVLISLLITVAIVLRLIGIGVLHLLLKHSFRDA